MVFFQNTKHIIDCTTELELGLTLPLYVLCAETSLRQPQPYYPQLQLRVRSALHCEVLSEATGEHLDQSVLAERRCCDLLLV